MRKILFAIVLMLLAAVKAGGQQCQVATDAFSGTALSPNWTALAGTEQFGIYNLGVGLLNGTQEYGVMRWTGTGTFNPNQYASLTLTQIKMPLYQNLMGPAVLVSGSQVTMYWGVIYGSQIYIQRVINGVYKNLVNAPYTAAVGDVLTISVSNGTLTLTYGPKASPATLTASDSAITTGVPGIVGQAYSGSSTITLGRPWSAGNVGSCTPGVSLSWMASTIGGTCSSSTIITYNVYRMTMSPTGALSNYGRIATGLAGTTYIDPVVTGTTTNYWYWVTAVDGCGESAQSNPAGTLTSGSPPTVTGSAPTTPGIALTVQ